LEVALHTPDSPMVTRTRRPRFRARATLIRFFVLLQEDADLPVLALGLANENAPNAE